MYCISNCWLNWLHGYSAMRIHSKQNHLLHSLLQGFQWKLATAGAPATVSHQVTGFLATLGKVAFRPPRWSQLPTIIRADFYLLVFVAGAELQPLILVHTSHASIFNITTALHARIFGSVVSSPHISYLY